MISFYKSSLLTEQNEHAAALLQDVQGDAALLKVRRSQCHGSIVMLLVFNHLPFRQEELEELRGNLSSAEARESEAREEVGKHAQVSEEVVRKLERTESQVGTWDRVVTTIEPGAVSAGYTPGRGYTRFFVMMCLLMS